MVQDGEEPSVRTVIDEAKEMFITKFHDVPFTHIKHKIVRPPSPRFTPHIAHRVCTCKFLAVSAAA
ncbi:hypothetical protein EON67_06275 [archaeon]|nr:MAG: hypothetical protein EON67_06275 [archaeon]